MNYSFIIRKAVPEDAPAIRDIVRESFRKYKEDSGITGTLEALEESVETVRDDILAKEVFIAEIDGRPVGSVRVQINANGTAHISRFAVKLEYCNMGIGKAIMDLVDKVLISGGVKKVFLYTASKNGNLVRFYYSRGFYVDSTSRDRGYIRALMVKEY